MHDAQLLFDGGGGMTSKVMERLENEWLKSPYQISPAQFAASQIRAAIKEFAEMAEVLSMADSVDGEWNTDHVDHVRQALAAFGVEEK
jgi:hypothetical protein